MKRRSHISKRVLKPPDSSVLFLDRNFGSKVVAEWLKRTQQLVEVHSDHFGHKSPDHIWIPECAKNQWIIASPDKRIETNPLNKAAVIASRAKVFIVASGGLIGEELGSILVVCRKRILQLARSREGPFFVRISKHAEMAKPRFFSPDEQKKILENAGWESGKSAAERSV